MISNKKNSILYLNAQYCTIFIRIQSATMRDLDEDASVESLKEKNQKVSNLLRKTTQLNIRN